MFESFQVPAALVVAQLGLALWPQILEFGGIDNRVAVGEVAELPDLCGGKGGLNRSPSSDHVDFPDLAVRQGFQGLLSDVRIPELGDGFTKDAADVGCHVSLADHHGHFGLQIKDAVLVVGVAVVPRHELRCGVAAGQVFSFDAEIPVGFSPACEDYRVVEGAKFGYRQIMGHRDVPEEREALVGSGLLVHSDHVLDLGVIGCHAVTNQAKWGGKPVVHRHIDNQG